MNGMHKTNFFLIEVQIVACERKDIHQKSVYVTTIVPMHRRNTVQWFLLFNAYMHAYNVHTIWVWVLP